MSSWSNKDLYVAYGFGSSNVNGYYFPSDSENYWSNTTNNVSLIYGGTHWWLRENIPSTYTHYYYGAENDGSGICDNLIFAANSVYGVCEGINPIGEVIYGGEMVQSTSSSSSESSESSESSNIGLYCFVGSNISGVNGYYWSTGTYWNGQLVYFNGTYYLYYQSYQTSYVDLDSWVAHPTIEDDIDPDAYKNSEDLNPEGDDWWDTYPSKNFSVNIGACSSSESQITSSSSSSSSSFSSSSSSSHTDNLELFLALVNQGHHDLLPFSFSIERGIESDGTLDFSFTKLSNSLSYSALLDFNTISAQTTSTFVPESSESKYKHEPIFYTDIIVEGQGINEYSLRSQQDLYTKEKPKIVFNIPKFSWDDSIFGEYGNTSESSVDFKEGYIWIGTSDNYIKKVYYNMDSATPISSFSTASSVHKIAFGEQDNSVFVSCYDNLLVYTNTSYYSGESTFLENQNISNETNDLMALDDKQSGYLISVQSYQGNVIFRDRNTLDVVNTYSGFDAPFKVVWSKAHNCYLVAGTHTLWKLENGQKTAVYNIKNYTIVDFDCSESGVVGIIFKGSDYILRFLSKNMYTMLYNERITGKDVRYCHYCEQGKFYVLMELINGEAYSTVSYLFDSIAKTLTKTESINSIVTTTTTTIAPSPSGKVEIVDPSAAAIWLKGKSYNIKWYTDASISDLVKIELFKGVKLVDTLVEETGNTGIYVWNISTNYENGDNYKVKVTWLSAGDSSHFDVSKAFTITNVAQAGTNEETQSEGTLAPILDRSIGVEYDPSNNLVVIVLNNGLIAIYDLSDYTFNGLIESGVNNAYCIAAKDKKIRKFSGVNKVRIYVGDEQYLSNKWDSGINN